MVVNEALDLAGERLPFKPQLVSKHDRIHLARFPLPRYLTPIYPLTLSQGGMGGFVTHLLRNSIVDFIGFFNVTLVTRNMRNMTVDMIDLFLLPVSLHTHTRLLICVQSFFLLLLFDVARDLSVGHASRAGGANIDGHGDRSLGLARGGNRNEGERPVSPN